MIAMPDGYALGLSKAETRNSARAMLGDDWQVHVYYKGRPAFMLAKQWRFAEHAPEYAGKLVGADGAWHRSKNLHELVAIMCTKHRIGVGR